MGLAAGYSEAALRVSVVNRRQPRTVFEADTGLSAWAPATARPAPNQPPAPPNFHHQRGRDCTDTLNAYARGRRSAGALHRQPPSFSTARAGVKWPFNFFHSFTEEDLARNLSWWLPLRSSSVPHPGRSRHDRRMQLLDLHEKGHPASSRVVRPLRAALRRGGADDLSVQYRNGTAHLLPQLRHTPLLRAALRPRSD